MGDTGYNGLRVLVTGGRCWDQRQDTFNYLDYIHQEVGIAVLIHGDAAGADTLCKEWAIENGITISVYPITKNDWAIYGRTAGHRRNQQMLDEGKPDVLVVFPGGAGTKDMVRRAKRHNVEIWSWSPT